MSLQEFPEDLAYLGWSGFRLQFHPNSPIYIDPPKGTVFPVTGDVVVLLTHGHPEHLGGTISLLKSDCSCEVTIVASTRLCVYLSSVNKLQRITFRGVSAGLDVRLSNGISLSIFSWDHIPLMPPGLPATFQHAWRLLRHAQEAWRIIRMMLKGPKVAGPMIGFVIHQPKHAPVIIYGEGLHRRCRKREVAEICATIPGATLLAAVEPEDEAFLPAIICECNPGHVVLYEPHKKWRRQFKMPFANLRALRAALMERGIPALIANDPGPIFIR